MQLRQRNAPDVSDEVSLERGEDIQIHDGFGAMESKDQEDEKRIKKNRDLQALMQLRQRNAPDVSDEVARERGENIQIHDGFGAMESKDQEDEKRIKKNRDMQAFIQTTRNAPDVSDEVARERGEDIQIHDGFGAMESKDQEDEKRIKKNR